MRSTRNDKESGLGGGMCRGELMESVVRTAQMVVNGKSPSENLKIYLRDCIKPYVENSEIHRVREVIR